MLQTTLETFLDIVTKRSMIVCIPIQNDFPLHTIMTRRSPILLLAIFISHAIGAQVNYDRQEFGAVNTLTGGACIASVRDNAAIYYNPGALGHIDSASISLTTDVYGFDYYNLKNDAGTGQNMKSFKTDIFPQIAAGSMIVKKAPKLRITYGTLTRFSNNYKFNINTTGRYDVIPRAPGQEYYSAQAEYELSSIEQWGGIGLAYRVSKVVSLGMSAFASYLSYEAHASTNVNVDAMNGSTTYSTSVNEYNGSEISQLNGIFKFGAAFDFGALKLGATITAPGFRMYSSGRIDKTLQGYNLNVNNPDTITPLFRRSSFTITDAADGLKVHYFQPAAFALGASYHRKRFTFHFSADLTLGKKNHVLMSSPNVENIYPYTGSSYDTVRNFLNVTTSIRPVFNVHMGIEYLLVKNFYLLAGLRTDFSNQEQFLPNNNDLGVQTFNIPSWNYLHLSLGGSYRKGAQLITAGLNYGIGIPVSSYQAINLTEPQQSLFLRGVTQTNTSTSVHFLVFVLGYTYYFKK